MSNQLKKKLMNSLTPKILIVDNLLDNTKALEKLLISVDAEIISAQSSDKALKLVLKHTFALILLELDMLDIDGCQTVKYILSDGQNKDTPIFFIATAQQNKIHRIKGYQAGVVDYIEKPINELILLRKIQIFLNIYNKHALLQQQYEHISTMTDEFITQRKHYEYELLKQQNYDDVTDLPNRVLVLDRLTQATAYSERTQKITTVIFIDVDNFKMINESLGHLFGNKVLIEIATRLVNFVRKGDTVARVGGDEFLVILPGLEVAESISSFCSKLLNYFTQAIHIDEQDIYISLSMGVTRSPIDANNSLVLMQNAESAMYLAKSQGRHTFRFFTSSMNVEAAEKIQMESRLHHALEEQALEVYYQPLLDCKTEQLIGAEALLRWNDKKLGFVSPDDFIPLAELSNLINIIGAWVLSTATLQAQQWCDQHQPNFRIAVNFSAQQFSCENISQEIANTLKKSKLSFANLEIEITEGLLMHEHSDVLTRLLEIVNLDINLSIDDFGTGYSSLSYLKRFPINTVKIDKSFINSVTTDPEDAILTKTIITMAHSLGMKVIAEGVETKEQLKFLQAHNCDTVQGYYFSKPVPAKEFEKFFNLFNAN